jgi:hypothetical protein
MRKTSTSRAKVKKNRPKAKLGVPDLAHSKAAVLRSLGSPDSRRGYQHAIDEFVTWYCSEPRLAFNKTIVLRYRFSLEERGLAPGTINVRIAAVPRLAYEAADSGLLSPELAAGIHRVKGIRKLGYRLGNWLTAGEASAGAHNTEWIRDCRFAQAIAINLEKLCFIERELNLPVEPTLPALRSGAHSRLPIIRPEAATAVVIETTRARARFWCPS